jgi:nitric oxide reductase activation protein
MSKNMHPNDADSAQKCQKAEALLSNLTRLQAEMLRVKMQMDSLRSCPSEIVLQVNNLMEQAAKLSWTVMLLVCSLRDGIPMPNMDIEDLQKDYERLGEAWSNLIKTAGLGLIYL